MKRFAIYFTPPEDSPLSRLATAWLGRDAFKISGPPAPEPSRNGFSREIWRAATSDPRLYGFHATLKPPFSLTAAFREPELLERVQVFAKAQKAFAAPALKVSSLSSFLALTLSEPSPALEALAEACVREFDEFRAPPLEEEVARRRHSKLSPKHLEYLRKWGYPYVMEEWRFHMTLTSSLEPGTFEDLGAHLKDLFSSHCRDPLLVDSLCVFEQSDAGAPFHVVERFPFS